METQDFRIPESSSTFSAPFSCNLCTILLRQSVAVQLRFSLAPQPSPPATCSCGDALQVVQAENGDAACHHEQMLPPETALEWRMRCRGLIEKLHHSPFRASLMLCFPAILARIWTVTNQQQSHSDKPERYDKEPRMGP